MKRRVHRRTLKGTPRFRQIDRTSGQQPVGHACYRLPHLAEAKSIIFGRLDACSAEIAGLLRLEDKSDRGTIIFEAGRVRLKSGKFLCLDAVVEGFRFQRVVARQLHGHVRGGDLSLIFGMALIYSWR
jgi:hypothetical protein